MLKMSIPQRRSRFDPSGERETTAAAGAALTTKEGASVMANNKPHDGTRFKQDVHGLGEGVHALKVDVNNLGRGAVDAVRSGASELRRGVKHAVDGARDAVTNSAGSVRGVIARNPVASVGIAAGVGVVIGLILRRTRAQK
jgi:ElaB/YqjD/DUF883 family membrane-anchored ribosome-binding protein